LSGVAARNVMELAVRRELFGPTAGVTPIGQPLDCTGGSVRFETIEASRTQFHDASTGEEILTQSDPLRRYGIGILHSAGSSDGDALRGPTVDGEEDLAWIQGLSENDEGAQGPTVELQGVVRDDEADSDDFDLIDANMFKPSAMAVSMKCRVAGEATLKVAVTGAYYDRVIAHIPGLTKPRDWWVRRPFEVHATVPTTVLLGRRGRLVNIDGTANDGPIRVSPTVQLFTRPVPREADPSTRLITVVVVNRSQGTGPSSALFQTGFTAEATDGLVIEPYPEVAKAGRDDEEESIDLLYRHRRTFAIGHGCAAEWAEPISDAVSWVAAETLPAFEVSSLTPNVYVTDDAGQRSAVVVSMAELAAGSAEGHRQVDAVLDLYEQWIEERQAEVAHLAQRFRPSASRHVDRCRIALARMREGWALVNSDAQASNAFRLTNEAMLYQQVRSRLPVREVERGKDDVLRPVGPHPVAVVLPEQGNWRPFQIAFLLAVVPEIADPTRATRRVVDLIFFPTGGGKTEAYLGASAFSLLCRRLRDPSDIGTDTLMRYTLRLLTAQQFLRAAALVCVLEDIRSRRPDELGEGRFGIGVWLGGESTPNTWRQAVQALGRLRRDPQAPNPFLLLRCPWCGTRLGAKPRGTRQDVFGYEQVGERVVHRCIDSECRFSSRSGLPVHVVDEDIYETRPSIIIGTVDKFAMMAWRPNARFIFGLGKDGERVVSPPSLIIQDELHLISGPLGSMVGLYEPIIDELCTNRRGEVPVSPKIIASTATVRRFEDQILGLFGRSDVALFPPHGLEEGRSFFAEPATLPDGSPEPGRRYIGLLSASLGSTQTVQVRVAAATLQGATEIDDADRDGYWTNLNFLNSLRELGNTVSLLESDVPDYLTGLRRRDGIDPRWPRHTMELTSRRRNDEIPRAIEQLQVPYGSQGCVDICLASNIIEVGIDIDRLGLMTIIGQPKTTAQYIQVSGRVGRRSDVSPGLVLTIYGAAKPRDRSHYERFRTYHQQLYAQVEPTSVTPFAAPVLRRALHAAAVAYIRQVSPDIEPHPFPREFFDRAVAILRRRAEKADPAELPRLDEMARTRARQWDRWERTQWEANAIGGDPKQGLMRFAGTLPDLDSRATIWDVPTSMRNVDAECRLRISLAYNLADADADREDEEDGYTAEVEP
jgi:hypothetical protein